MNRIKEIRCNKGIQQKALAIELGVSQATISSWERNEKQPSNKNAIKLADYFGISVDYLLGRKESSVETINQLAAQSNELDLELIRLMEDLPLEDFQRVKDFVAGLKAARKEPPSRRS